MTSEDDTGRSRGFGFVEFTQDISADRFEQAFPHIIYDRHLNVSRCGKIRQPLFRHAETKRILVSHPSSESSTHFLKYFSKFGPINKIIRDFGKEVPLVGYSFIDFTYPESVVKCLFEKQHTLDETNMVVYVRKIFTKEQTLRIFQKEREETYRTAREQTGSHSTSVEITNMRTQSLLKNKDVSVSTPAQTSQLASHQAGYLGYQKRENTEFDSNVSKHPRLA
uniref:RRM domain-containing protein n=1 Tax=Acrobeloides nanus TaxID=290746 RepID=A0A914CBL3_9BILA